MEAIDLYRDRGDGLAMARATLDAVHVYTTPQQVDRLVHDALTVLDGADPHLEALLLAELVSQTLGRDLRTDAERDRLATLAASHHYDDVTAAVLLGETFYAFGDFQLGVGEATTRSRDAYERFDRLGEPGRALLALSTWAMATRATGDIDAGLAAGDELADYARRHGARYIEDVILNGVSGFYFARCDWDGIDRRLAEHRERVPDSHESQVIDALRLWMAGRLDEAIAANPPPHPAIFSIHLLDLSRQTELLHCAGRFRDAADTFAQLRTLLGESAHIGLYALALLWLGGHIVGYAVEEFLTTLDELLRRHDADDDPRVFGQGSVQRVFGDYDFARGRVDDAERRYRETLTWAERERCPLDEGRTHLGLADIAEHRGNHPDALDHLEAAGAIFARHGLTYYLNQVLAKKEILKA